MLNALRHLIGNHPPVDKWVFFVEFLHTLYKDLFSTIGARFKMSLISSLLPIQLTNIPALVLISRIPFFLNSLFL